MNSANRYAIRRFLMKTAILVVFAAAQWRHNMVLTLALLFGMASIIDVGLALMKRTALRQDFLSYWDEAAVFFFLTLVAAAVVVRTAV